MYFPAVALSFLPHALRLPIALLATLAHGRHPKYAGGALNAATSSFLPIITFLPVLIDFTVCSMCTPFTHIHTRTHSCSSNTFLLSQQCNGKFLCLLQSSWLVFPIDFKTAAVKFLGLHCVRVNWISHRNCQLPRERQREKNGKRERSKKVFAQIYIYEQNWNISIEKNVRKAITKCNKKEFKINFLWQKNRSNNIKGY